MHRHLWDAEKGMFADYLWKERRSTGHVTAATLYPLYFGIADRRQAEAVAQRVRADLLQPHGLATTTLRTGQQWDAPNGWAPLQWIAIQGLHDYGHEELAASIAERWIRRNVAVYPRNRQAGGEVRRRQRVRRRWRRRIPAAGRVRLDQRRAAQAHRAVSGGRGGAGTRLNEFSPQPPLQSRACSTALKPSPQGEGLGGDGV